MKNLILFLLLAVTVNARWSAHYSRQIAANQDLDWWEHGTFYQVKTETFFQRNEIKDFVYHLRFTQGLSKTVTEMELEIFEESSTTWII